MQADNQPRVLRLNTTLVRSPWSDKKVSGRAGHNSVALPMAEGRLLLQKMSLLWWGGVKNPPESAVLGANSLSSWFFWFFVNKKWLLIREGPFPNFFPSGILKFGNGNFSGIRYSRIFRVQEFREFGIPVRDYQIFGIPVHLGWTKNLQTIGKKSEKNPKK